ncbi:MAG: hypothetical protein ACLR23_02315 [Clostridia bacterium]
MVKVTAVISGGVYAHECSTRYMRFGISGFWFLPVPGPGRTNRCEPVLDAGAASLLLWFEALPAELLAVELAGGRPGCRWLVGGRARFSARLSLRRPARPGR